MWAPMNNEWEKLVSPAIPLNRLAYVIPYIYGCATEACQRYSIKKNKWDPINPPQYADLFSQVTGMNGKLYKCGSLITDNQCEVFDHKEWKSIDPIPYSMALFGFAFAASKTQLYVCKDHDCAIYSPKHEKWKLRYKVFKHKVYSISLPMSSSATQDPHLSFPGGYRADFRGVPGKIFAFVSLPRFQANVRIDAATFRLDGAVVHGTFMSAIYMRCGAHRVFHQARNGTFDFKAVGVQCAARSTPDYVFPYRRRGCGKELKVSVDYATSEVRCGERVVARTSVRPVAERLDGVSHRIDIHFSGIEGAHGIVGQNYDRPRNGRRHVYPRTGVFTTSAQAEGAIEGVHTDYLMADPYSTVFRFSRFD